MYNIDTLEWQFPSFYSLESSYRVRHPWLCAVPVLWGHTGLGFQVGWVSGGLLFFFFFLFLFLFLFFFLLFFLLLLLSPPPRYLSKWWGPCEQQQTTTTRLLSLTTPKLTPCCCTTWTSCHLSTSSVGFGLMQLLDLSLINHKRDDWVIYFFFVFLMLVIMDFCQK